MASVMASATFVGSFSVGFGDGVVRSLSELFSSVIADLPPPIGCCWVNDFACVEGGNIGCWAGCFLSTLTALCSDTGACAVVGVGVTAV